MFSLRRPLLALLALAGLAGSALAGCSASEAAASNASKPTTRTISFLAQTTDRLFLTESGASSQYPSRPLAPGDRVIDHENISENGTKVGNAYELCTVSLGLYVLCDYEVDFGNAGTIRASWTFQWPASGTAGPPSWSGVVEGGTGLYRNAIGEFHVNAQPNGDLATAYILQPSSRS
jgi:hypothetical protein